MHQCRPNIIINIFYYIIYLYINLRSRDGAFVRVCVRSCGIVTLDSHSSLWPAFTLCASMHYNEIVHRKQQHTSGINTIP